MSAFGEPIPAPASGVCICGRHIKRGRSQVVLLPVPLPPAPHRVTRDADGTWRIAGTPTVDVVGRPFVHAKVCANRVAFHWPTEQALRAEAKRRLKRLAKIRRAKGD